MAADEENGLSVCVLVGGGVDALMRDRSVASSAASVSLVFIHWAAVAAASVSLVFIHWAALCATVAAGVCAAATGIAGGVRCGHR